MNQVETVETAFVFPDVETARRVFGFVLGEHALASLEQNQGRPCRQTTILQILISFRKGGQSIGKSAEDDTRFSKIYQATSASSTQIAAQQLKSHHEPGAALKVPVVHNFHIPQWTWPRPWTGRLNTWTTKTMQCHHTAGAPHLGRMPATWRPAPYRSGIVVKHNSRSGVPNADFPIHS